MFTTWNTQSRCLSKGVGSFISSCSGFDIFIRRTSQSILVFTRNELTPLSLSLIIRLITASKKTMMKGVAMGMFMAAMKADYESKIFQVRYLDCFGVMPEQEEINVFRDAVMVIFSFAGSGKTMLGREKLRNKVYQYADIVDDDPVAIRLFCTALITTALPFVDISELK